MAKTNDGHFRVGTALKFLLLIGTVGFVIDMTSFIALRYSSSAIGTVLLKTDVLMVNIISVLLYKERFTKKDWGLSITMLIGVLMVLGVNPLEMTFRASDILFLVSALGVTINAFLIKHTQSMETGSVNNDVIAYYNNFITMVCFLVTSLFLGEAGDIQMVMANKDIQLALLLGGVGQLLVYRLYYKSLRELPVWVVKVILLLMPVFTLVFNVVFFDETPGWQHLVGMAVVLASAAGIILEQSQQERMARK